MKRVLSAAPIAPILCGLLLLLLLLAGIPTARAQTGSIAVDVDDVEYYVVDRYDEDGDTYYEVTSSDLELPSVYKFDSNGFATHLRADNEKYRFLYRNNGKLRKVKLVSSRRNLLGQGEDNEEGGANADAAKVDETVQNPFVGGADQDTAMAHETTPPGDASADTAVVLQTTTFVGDANQDTAMVDEIAPSDMAMGEPTTTTPAHPGRRRRRRLFESCDECQQTWDTVCGNGVEAVCNLKGYYGSPILSAGQVSIDAFCNDFGGICEVQTADDVCQEECGGGGGGGGDDECLAPLKITLEYTGGESQSYSESHNGYFLDLYVIEPGGKTVFWDNEVSDTGYWGAASGGSSYTVFSGLDGETATGRYIVFVEWYNGAAPVPWTITATTGSGEVIYSREGEFTGDCHMTGPFFLSLGEYIDEGCGGGGR